MNLPIIIFLAFMVVFCAGFFYSTMIKMKKQKELLGNTDFKSEMSNAERYKKKYLTGELSFLSEQMGTKPIDAFNYANLNYSTKDTIADGVKDGLKGMATLGTVKFTTVHTPKYLMLSGSDLHLIDIDTDGEISDHLVFDAQRLKNSTIDEIPLEGNIKAFAKKKGELTKAYLLSLATENKPIEIIIFSALIFTYADTGLSALSLNANKDLQDIIIGSDFLKKLGDKYPNLKVLIPVLT